MKEYDVIVIGTGGGTKLGTPCTKLGLKVALIEKGPIGGTCLNRGCIPSKLLIHPADVAVHIQEASKFDIHNNPEFTVDFAKLTTRISNTVDKDSQSIRPNYDKNELLDFYPYEGKFVSNKVIEVNGEQITAEKIFIAVGGRPLIPDWPGLEGTPYMTSTEALRNTKQPKSMIVVGGGYIACELGHAYGGLGTDVHFLVRSRMIRREDPDIVDEFEKEFSKRYNVYLGAIPTQVSYENNEFTVTYSQDGSEKEIKAEALLVAIGTTPNSDTLNLESTDINVKSNGFIEVDDHLRTSVPGIWALGDVVGNYQFRHSVNFEGEHLFETIFLNEKEAPIEYPPMPHAVFTHPQVAKVGKTEQDLIDAGKQAGVDYVVGLNTYSSSAMGMARLSDHGFVKVIIDVSSRKLIGAHVIGDEASNLINTFIYAMTTGGTIDDLLKMIYIHPALPEIARNACRKARAALNKVAV